MPPEQLSSEPVELTVDAAESGHRLDAFLARHFCDYSRMHLRRVITAGGVKVDGRGGKPAYRLKPGQLVSIVLPEIPREAPTPENIPLDVLYADEYVAAINKPPGMVVHPARGHWSGTLASALQYHFGPGLSSSGGPSRPGIVHRLDRDTSGVILVARTDQAHTKLAAQFADRSIQKEYFALVAGRPDLDRDVIDQSIGIHPHKRERMAVRKGDSSCRSAQTFYEVIERFDGFAAVKLLPKTGRTHQLRVHLDYIGCPVLCDRQYGGRSKITRGDVRRDPDDAQVLLSRQALHARRLRCTHPHTMQPFEIEAPLPADIVTVLAELRAYRGL
ncbi:MAG: RluA family pseudouridine synthase [Candidatus Nealsonbacteria bacterium]|nr:RluA family pseudouridine synthase [Candidatus Nealsonbacteria bacterium]